MVEGSVQAIKERPYNGKVLYSVKLSDGVYYGFGSDKPEFSEGAKVKFGAVKNASGYWNALTDSVEVVSQPTGEVTSAPSAQAPAFRKFNGAKGGAVKDEYWTNKEVRDVHNDRLRERGASRNTAIAWINLLVSNGAIVPPAKAASKEDFFNALLDDYTARFQTDAIAATPPAATEPAVVKAPKKKKEVEVVEQEEDGDDWN